MSEHRPGEGGSANTPPFPRLVTDDPDLTRTPGEGSGRVDAGPERVHVVTDAVSRPEIREIPLAGWEEPSSQASPPQEPVGEEAAESEGDDELSDLVSGAADQVRRAGRSVNRGFQNVADQLEDLADRLDSVAGLGEARGAAGLATFARKSSEYLGDSAAYLRTRDVKEMRADLESQVRTSPLKTLLVAIGAGWLVGKIVR